MDPVKNICIDVSTYTVNSGPYKTRLSFTDNNGSADIMFSQKIPTAHLNGLQTNFTIGSDRSIKSAFNTLDDGSGNMIVDQVLPLKLPRSNGTSVYLLRKRFTLAHYHRAKYKPSRHLCKSCPRLDQGLVTSSNGPCTILLLEVALLLAQVV